MNKRTTRSSTRSNGSLASLKQTNLIIYLAIIIILVGVCGVLYGKYMSKTESNLPLTAGNTEQANGNKPLADDPIPAGTVDNDEKEEPVGDKSDAVDDKSDVVDNNNDGIEEDPIPPATHVPVKENNKPVESPKPVQTEKPVQEQKDTSVKPTEAPVKTVKLPTTYVVQKGDTLSSISEKFYQSKEHYALIAEHNNILFINDMKVGDTLNIPALSSTNGSKDKDQQGTKDYSKINLPATYLIQAGDTLSGISRMFYKSAEYVDYIAKENKLDKNVGLKAGTNLVIPSLKNYKPEEGIEVGETAPIYETTDHTVKSGETLYSISKLYYGSNKYAMFIADYNQLVDIDNLKAGTVLKIPKA